MRCMCSLPRRLEILLHRAYKHTQNNGLID